MRWCDALDEFLRRDLTGYKVPGKWYRVDTLPQTLSGKIQKFAIKDKWREGEYTELR